jgi:ATP diphosphatase
MAEMMKPSREISRLIEIMAALRTPVTGCPWDLEQSFETIAPYTIEEAYEVADAIERRDLADLRDELGDLLLQVVYHSRLAEEQGAFAFGDVVEAVTKKMIRRHPHVFGDGPARDPATVRATWDQLKAEERAEKSAERARMSDVDRPTSEGARTLSDVPSTLPALTRAIKLQGKAAKVGFDWPNLLPVFEKLKEEIQEFEEVALPHDPRVTSDPHRSDEANAKTVAAVKEEFGDMLFVMANIARHLEIDPEAALRGANAKFVRRFAYIEKVLDERGKNPAQSNLAEMDELWNEAKAIEKS